MTIKRKRPVDVPRTYGAKLDRLLALVRERGALMDELAGPEERVSIHLNYPRLFAELMREHSIAAFDARDVRVFGNLKGEEENLDQLLGDRGLTDALVEAGFLPFGRHTRGSYDRICFDMRDLREPIDAPVVLMDHEEILSFLRIPRPVAVADGILALAENLRSAPSSSEP